MDEQTSAQGENFLGQNSDLILALIITFTAVVFIFTPLNSSIIRSILGYLVIFFIPGYTLLAAVFPAKFDIGKLERFVFSICVSLLAAPLIGAVLNYTEWGVTTGSVVACLTGVILACCTVAWWRRSRLSQSERFSLDLTRDNFGGYLAAPKALKKSDWVVNNKITVMLVVFVVASALLLSYITLAPQGQENTAFYILDANGKAVNYPTQLKLGKPEQIVVGISNGQNNDMEYTLKVVLSNGTQQSTLYSNHSIIASKQTWEQPIMLTPNISGSDMKLQFLLYRAEETSTYKECHLWVNVTST
jgi:uncharacterized membrane protein